MSWRRVQNVVKAVHIVGEVNAPSGCAAPRSEHLVTHSELNAPIICAPNLPYSRLESCESRISRARFQTVGENQRSVLE